MLLSSRAQDSSPLTVSTLCSTPYFNNRNSNFNKAPTFPTLTGLSLLRSCSVSFLLHHHRHSRRLILPRSPLPFHFSLQPFRSHVLEALYCSSASDSTLGEPVAGELELARDLEKWVFPNNKETGSFDFDGVLSSTDLKHIGPQSLEVKELDELPEQWRRSKLAWLCKELPAQKPSTMIRLLNAQRKWIRQEDVTYVAVHCMRVRENEAGFRIYQWMMQQHWFKFDFALATKLADYMGKERKYLKCRKIFDDIINQGRVPSESTFHILIVSYLSSSSEGFIEEACSIYNCMIQLGGYKPQLSLHNSLFRALVSKSGSPCKHYLKMAEFIFHNLTTSGLEIHKDIYGSLIWLHSYQDIIDMKRIMSIRVEMLSAGIEEGTEVLLSILRACSKVGDTDEAERTWTKLACSSDNLPSQAFVYKMEVYAKVGEPMKSLEIFRDMQEQLNSSNVVACHKIIEVLCKSQESELAESLMAEFINSGLKPLMPSFIKLMEMYSKLGLHENLESTFFCCLKKSRPNQIIYDLYLESLVQISSLDKAEEIFNQMYSSGDIGVNARSCNAILKGYISRGEYVKAEKIYDLMCKKKYDIESSSMEKLDYILSLRRGAVKKPISIKLSKEQREILIGLLLGGLKIISDEKTKNHVVHFEFNDSSRTHYVLKRHIHDQYHEWLASPSEHRDGVGDISYCFNTFSHTYFGFYADQFWPKGKPVVPKLIHRWLSPRVLGYWYMYGGYRTLSGNVLLKVKGSREGVGRIVKALKEKSLDCRVKRNGRFFWIGLLGSNSIWFWKLVEPFVLEDLKDLLRTDGKPSEGMVESHDVSFGSGSDTDDVVSVFSDVEL